MHNYQLGYIQGYEAESCETEENFLGDFECENGGVLVPIYADGAIEAAGVYGCVQCPQNAVYEFGYENGVGTCLCELDPACVAGEEPEDETEDTTEPE